jgi:hypothetical protein
MPGRVSAAAQARAHRESGDDSDPAEQGEQGSEGRNPSWIGSACLPGLSGDVRRRSTG